MVLFLWNSIKLKKFDLADELLNLKPTKHVWGNLGYWENTDQYHVASEQLAKQVADLAHLDQEAHILDIGFGCGEQLLLWAKHYQVASITGLNPSYSQYKYAKQLISDNNVKATLYNAPHTHISYLPTQRYSHLISVDAAYFFSHRKQWFSLAHQALSTEGQLVLTDLILPHEPDNLLQKGLLYTLLKLCGVPKENIVTAEVYQKQLTAAGFKHYSMNDISNSVLDGFSQWLPQYKQQFPGLSNYPIWQKYEGTAKVLAWLRKHDLIRCYLIRAER
jgi:cyclopropane fatty-acyl-phospholipid synthase-like methyltransferase